MELSFEAKAGVIPDVWIRSKIATFSENSRPSDTMKPFPVSIADLGFILS
jgi:hypothetical protein